MTEIDRTVCIIASQWPESRGLLRYSGPNSQDRRLVEKAPEDWLGEKPGFHQGEHEFTLPNAYHSTTRSTTEGVSLTALGGLGFDGEVSLDHIGLVIPHGQTAKLPFSPGFCTRVHLPSQSHIENHGMILMGRGAKRASINSVQLYSEVCPDYPAWPG